jgi:uracil-DNA glycosylase
MSLTGTFPFGKQVKKVEQEDRTPKQVFVLGVYASAVHAQWVGKNSNHIIKALAVDSEPYIFWRGDGVEEIIDEIHIPTELGKLVPAHKQFNGPSGIALDELILKPMGLNRDKSWLCDLVPHSCMNPSQKEAIAREYLPLVDEYKLSVPTVPEVPKRLTDETRRKAILEEFIMSKADVLVLLGDKPIQWFLKFFDDQWKRLSDFEMYGRLHEARVGSITVNVLPLAHPRQIAKLGRSSKKWFELHQIWLDQYAFKVLK